MAANDAGRRDGNNLGPEIEFCRICFEPGTENHEELISPCMCKGTQQYVHRSCLDHWRSVKEGFAFSHCTTCNAQFHLQVVEQKNSWRKTKFRLLVARDVLLVFLAVQLVIATIGCIAFCADKYGNRRESLKQNWERVISKHPFRFYYCVGGVQFLLLLGFGGFMLHYYAVGNERYRNQLRWALFDHFPTSVESFVITLIASIIVFVLLGVVYSVLAITITVQRIWQKHYNTLMKKELTKEYIVLDINGDYTPPELDAEHEERLRALKLL